jgi:hypothetical protein
MNAATVLTATSWSCSRTTSRLCQRQEASVTGVSAMDHDEISAKLGQYLSGFAGQICTRWRSDPGSTVIIDFGCFIPLYADRTARTSIKDRGAWVLIGWVVDLLVALPTGEVLNSREIGEVELLKRIPSCPGLRMLGAEIAVDEMVVSLSFADGTTIKMRPALDAEADEELWSILTPDRKAVRACADGRWEFHDPASE